MGSYSQCLELEVKISLLIPQSYKRAPIGRAPYKSGWALFWVFLQLTSKECPGHVSSDSIPLKQLFGQKITYNGTTTDFEVESWQHTTLWMAPCHSEHDVARGAHLSTQRCFVVTLSEVFNQVFYYIEPCALRLMHPWFNFPPLFLSTCSMQNWRGICYSTLLDVW